MTVKERALLFLCRHWWTLYTSADFAVTVDHGICVPVLRAAGLDNLEFREEQFKAVIERTRRLRPGTYVDVGANLGKFLLNLIAVDRDLPYLGFEPNIYASHYVQAIIARNHLRNHAVLTAGLSDTCGTATLLLNDPHDASATMSKTFRPAGMYRNRCEVALLTGDAALASVESIALLKIDVEGLEAQVLRGCSTTIERHRPPILLESLPYAYLEDGSYDRAYFGEIPEGEVEKIVAKRKEAAAAVERYLCERDYQLFSVGDGHQLQATGTLDRGDSKDHRNSDFLAVPREDVGALGR